VDRIGAYRNNCSAIITYDDHFDELRQAIEVCTPEVFLARGK
jgi:predicted nucleic acid-binding protein